MKMLPGVATRAIGRQILKWTNGIPGQYFDRYTPTSFNTAQSSAYGTFGQTPTLNVWAYMAATQHSIVAAAVQHLVNGIETVRFGVQPVNNPKAPLDFGHQAMMLLNAPGPTQTRGERLWRIVESMTVMGNSLLVPHKDEDEGPMWLEVTDPRYVRWPVPGMRQIRYEVRNPFEPGSMRQYGRDQVAHLRHHLSPDGMNGMGLLTRDTLNEIDTDRAAQAYTHTLMTRMGVPGMIMWPGDGPERDEYTRQEADALMKLGQEVFSAGGVGKWLVLDKKWDTFEPRGANAQRIDLSKIRNVSEERILADFGIHPALLGVGTGTQNTRVGATMLAIRRHYAQATLQPLAHRIAEQLTAELLPFTANPYGYCVKPDFTDCMPVAEALIQIENERMLVAIAMKNAGLWDEAKARAYVEGA